MKVGILGAGNMATALGRRFIEKGHKLLVSYSRDRGKLGLAGAALATRLVAPRAATREGEKGDEQ